MQFFSSPSETQIVTSVAWANAMTLAVGLNTGHVFVCDRYVHSYRRCFNCHTERVSVLDWHRNGQLLASAGRDEAIMIYDTRVSNALVSVYRNHSGEVCGLKWSPSGDKLASGANDNLVNVWDTAIVPIISYNQARSYVRTRHIPLYTFDQHTAATKALAWCPWSDDDSLLASGGGIYDRTVKFWNIANGELLKSVATTSQVTSILWSKNSREFVTSHGGGTNHLSLWTFPRITELVSLKEHTDMITQTALSPDGTTVASLGADERLRFWRMFEEKQGPREMPNTTRRFDFASFGSLIR